MPGLSGAAPPHAATEGTSGLVGAVTTGLPPSLVVLAAALGTALLASAWPLATYGLSLAMFGLAHVLSELRYLDGRFGPRLTTGLLWSLGLGLLGVVLLRVTRILGWVEAELGTPAELVLVLALIVSVLPFMLQRSIKALFLGLGVSAALARGVWVDPFTTILILAILHNWTPVGFAIEATQGAERTRAVGLSLLVFGLVPAALALGLGPSLLDSLGLRAANAAPLLKLGTLQDHFGAFLPSAWRDRSWAESVFGAVAYAQCMHYAAVLHVLPRLHQGGPGPLARIPSGRFVLGLVVVSALFFWGFTWDFKEFRRYYGVMAAVHAWVEWPLLLLALVRPYRP